MGWLNRERLGVYPKIICVCYLLILGYLYLGGSGLLDARGDPIGGDFCHYWVASALALKAGPAAVYDPDRFLAAQREVFGIRIPLIWLYPPTFLLLILPLGLLPYLVALGLWLSLPLAGLVLVVRRIAPSNLSPWLTLAFPGIFMNVIHGQNGLLSASLLGAGLLLLEQAPVTAGVLLGLLSYKPHLAVLIPLALAAGRRWRALLSLGISALALIAASLLVLGPGVWAAFFQNLPGTLAILETGRLGKDLLLFTAKMPTWAAAVLLAGGPAWLAQLLQAGVMLAAAGIVFWVWSRETAPAGVRAAVLVLCALLFPPYEFLYDLAILALPLAWLAWEGHVEGWRPGEPALLVLAFLTPVLTPIFAGTIRLQIAPLVLTALVAMALRRLRPAAPLMPS
ncbi:MAG: glycosyltransferase family 87 protein [Desulfobaccales bacterium]